MDAKTRQGLFHVIDSFTIKRRNEVYLIGNLLEGEINAEWFVNIPLNKSLSFTGYHRLKTLKWPITEEATN